MNLNQIVWLDFDYMNKHYEAEAIPTLTFSGSSTPAYEIYLENEYSGTIIKDSTHLLVNNYIDCELLKIIRNKLLPFLKND